MLVLSRRVGERILIGDDIVVTVVDVRHDTVRLGIAAPRSVRVNRAEVHQAVAQANRDATQAAESAVAAVRSLRRPATTPADADAGPANPGPTSPGPTSPGRPDPEPATAEAPPTDPAARPATDGAPS